MRLPFIPILSFCLIAPGLLSAEETMSQTRSFGTWTSPLSAQALVAGARGFSELGTDEASLYFIESRPEEGGRQALMRRLPNGEFQELAGPEFNVRSRAHEYGGGALLVGRRALYFTQFTDQRLYRLVPGAAPEPLGPGGDRRFADCVEDHPRGRLVCVQEDHTGEEEPRNSLVSLSARHPETPRTLFAGSDFVAAPALSADGNRLAFLSWKHPNMPWDDVQLQLAELNTGGSVHAVTTLNAGQREAVLSPQWGPDGLLYFVSDRDNWWNLYRMENGGTRQLTHAEFELGRPSWQFNQRLYVFLPDGRIAALSNDRGTEGLVLITPETGAVERLDLGFVRTNAIAVMGDTICLDAGFADRPGGIVAYDLRGGTLSMLRESQAATLPSEFVSRGEAVDFATADGETAHGFYYAPRNLDFRGPEGESPPLIVTVHGGPTSHTTPALYPRIQFWTTRGFAVFDLNYRGSTGFGRAYRHSLYSHWGSKDVADAVQAARFLAGTGRADPGKLLIRGGSAGGFTVLATHAFFDVFAAGANYYGVSDMEALATDTHKFESHYLDQLVGPYPAQKAKYRALSPIHHLDGFNRPLIVFQGLDDKVVPPAQSESIVRALKDKGVPVAYLPFAGEQHGFRKSENIVRAAEAELYFYGKVLGFTPADAIEPVAIEHLP
ncbi:MAG: S9 family peptidase [Gammaproteobacteria bacterium]|nr:S9 family peptidase [Gammaproteobacteria bacterium]